MSELAFIENIEAERTNLELHVDLCAQRYNQLIIKFDEVDRRLDHLTQLCSEIKESVTTVRTNTTQTHLHWAGAVIAILVSVCVSLGIYITTH